MLGKQGSGSGIRLKVLGHQWEDRLQAALDGPFARRPRRRADVWPLFAGSSAAPWRSHPLGCLLDTQNCSAVISLGKKVADQSSPYW